MIQLKNLYRTAGRTIPLFIIGVAATVFSCQAVNPPLVIKNLGDGHSLVQIEDPKKYLLLPIQDAAPEARIEMIVNNNTVQAMNVRMAVDQVDYFVPVELSGYDSKLLSFNFHSVPESALCWKEMTLSDDFTVAPDKFRPVYHFAPTNGWMNDPNGMFYKDGVYHLFYQHNPYGATWGNMHWGHATSKDLVTWEQHGDAIAPDALGTIFSGSAVVDTENTAGFGAGTIVAFYTSAGSRQTQSMAYSTDNGQSFKKYDRNPILTSSQPDFRDPKVIWHAATNRWVMVLAVGQEMQFYSSSDLKEWKLESSFGQGHGSHTGVWECPDLMEMTVDGTDRKKWVLLCNINPGGPFGGSATQYFVGSFDGKTFVNESLATTTKWMDYGKDHYATVTWNNAPEGRHIALAWMNNWQYANNVPVVQFSSANSVPRDLSLYTVDGEVYLQSAPSKELLKLRAKAAKTRSFKLDRTYNIDRLLPQNNGTYEIEMTIKNKNAEVIGFQLFNSKGEQVEMYYNLVEKKFAMDRTKSGDVSFSKEFPGITVTPLDAPASKEFKLRLFVDKSSIEAFGNDGRFAMTNLVFPTEPYNRISFYAKGGSCVVTEFTVYPLELK